MSRSRVLRVATAVGLLALPAAVAVALCEPPSVGARAPSPETARVALSDVRFAAASPACAAPVAELRQRLEDAGASQSDGAASALFDGVGALLDAHPGCSGELVSTTLDDTCGPAGRTALSALFGSARLDVDAAAGAAFGVRGACANAAASALQESRIATPALVAVAIRLTHDDQDDTRMLAWLALGSLGAVARREGSAPLVSHVEEVLTAELARSTGQHRVELIEASGNAGCARCLPDLLAAVGASDARVRRAAVSALRFQTSTEATSRMCALLGTDTDQVVRDQAAWALRFGRTDRAAREACLQRAAENDAAARVRRTAAGSLESLADAETEAEARRPPAASREEAGNGT